MQERPLCREPVWTSKSIVHHNDPISEFYDPETASSEFGYLWGNPDYKDLIFEYDQKHFNHAIQINEDTMPGEKAKC